MLLSEREAKQRWCPFVRYTSVRGSGINRWTDAGDENFNPNATRCLGSECMAWRWVEQPGPQPPNAPERDSRGWCGLAGDARPDLVVCAISPPVPTADEIEAILTPPRPEEGERK